MKPGQILVEKAQHQTFPLTLFYPAVTAPPESTDKFPFASWSQNQWIFFTDELVTINNSSAAQKAFQRLHYKAENIFGFSDALGEMSSNSWICEDQSDLCRNITS